MTPIPAESHAYEFCFIELDYTLVRVEETEGEVTIRATADTFSRQRKLCFIHELAAEGFIPDEYRWFSLAGPDGCSRGVRWLVDHTWLKVDEALVTRTQRLSKRLFVPVTMLWLLMLYLAFPSQSHATRSAEGARNATEIGAGTGEMRDKGARKTEPGKVPQEIGLKAKATDRG